MALSLEVLAIRAVSAIAGYADSAAVFFQETSEYLLPGAERAVRSGITDAMDGAIALLSAAIGRCEKAMMVIGEDRQMMEALLDILEACRRRRPGSACERSTAACIALLWTCSVASRAHIEERLSFGKLQHLSAHLDLRVSDPAELKVRRKEEEMSMLEDLHGEEPLPPTPVICQFSTLVEWPVCAFFSSPVEAGMASLVQEPSPLPAWESFGGVMFWKERDNLGAELDEAKAKPEEPGRAMAAITCGIMNEIMNEKLTKGAAAIAEKAHQCEALAERLAKVRLAEMQLNEETRHNAMIEEQQRLAATAVEKKARSNAEKAELRLMRIEERRDKEMAREHRARVQAASRARDIRSQRTHNQAVRARRQQKSASERRAWANEFVLAARELGKMRQQKKNKAVLGALTQTLFPRDKQLF